MRHTHRTVIVALGCLAACGEDPGNARFQTRASVQQIHVTHATPGAALELQDAAGAMVQRGTADELGSLMFRRLPPGEGYRVRSADGAEQSGPLKVLTAAESQPPASFYKEQKLQPGFNYIKTRDGTLLSAYVTLPGPPENGPYPTVVNYSGYEPSKPGKPISGTEGFCGVFPSLCDPPDDESALIASLFGYATVGVNLRGTGCSGGAYDYFETMQVLDGYDMIEVIAAQDFVQDHKVAMTGLSYPGISQLFVAQSQPPSLVAITPLSVIGNTATTLAPGGILNDGFALNWVTGVLNRAAPYGQGWEKARVDAGDAQCGENQRLHGQRVDNVAMARSMPFYTPELVEPLNPTAFAPRIQVPVFLAGSFEDEQTGPFFTTLLDRFTAAPLLRVTVYNGVHPDGFAPQVLAEWFNFLEFHVAHRIPKVPPALRALGNQLFARIYGTDKLQIPPDRFTSYKSFDEAQKAYRAEPVVKAIFESGNGIPGDPGAPQGTFDLKFAKWPPPETRPLRLFLREGGLLLAGMPPQPTSASAFQVDPEEGQRVTIQKGKSVFDKLPAWDYRPLKKGHAAVFESDQLDRDLVFLGTGSADLYIKSTANEADIEVNLTEVRPDNQEMYVQSGWLRASHRKLTAASTELWPEPTHLQADHAPLKPGEWVPVRVAIAGFGHVFRAGSRLRLSVDTPGDSRAEWRFDIQKSPGEVTVTVGHSKAQPSSIVLPLLPDVKVPSKLAPCPSLRGQPCRAYEAFSNQPG